MCQNFSRIPARTAGGNRPSTDDQGQARGESACRRPLPALEPTPEPPFDCRHVGDRRDRTNLGRFYALKKNLPERTHPLAEVLRTYKGQTQVERRFHHLKGPLAVAPMFLKNPSRIAGLLCALVWALMVLALMGRQVRRELKGQPLYGVYPEGRPSPAPTGPSLVKAPSGLSIVIVHQGGTVARRLAQPDSIQRRVIQLLGINSERLQTFKRRCGT